MLICSISCGRRKKIAKKCIIFTLGLSTKYKNSGKYMLRAQPNEFNPKVLAVQCRNRGNMKTTLNISFQLNYNINFREQPVFPT